MKIKIPKISLSHRNEKMVVKEKKYRKLNPVIIWRVLLCCACVLLCGSLVFHFYLYYTINKNVAPLVVEEETVPHIDQEKLSNTLQFFEKKNLVWEALSSTEETIKDPSL